MLSKWTVKKKDNPHVWGAEAPIYRGMRPLNAVNLNKIFASVEWAEMSLNEMKWAKMSEGPIYMRVETSLATLASLSCNIYYK